MQTTRTVIGALAGFLVACVAKAEPVLEQPIVAAAKAQFEWRLSSNGCGSYFRLYSSDLRNWMRRDGMAKVEIAFYVEYVSDKALYGTAARTVECLGRKVGEGFFEKGKTYASAVFVYTLSLWEMGWHVDRVELSPAVSGTALPSHPADLDWSRPVPSASALDLYNRGWGHFVRGEYDDALADYTAAIAANPAMALAYNNRCLVRVIAGANLEAARADCREAVLLAPHDPQVRETQGLVRLLVNDPRNALPEYDAALAVDPYRATALFGRGVAKARLGNSRGAQADKTAALKIDASVDRAFAKYGVR